MSATDEGLRIRSDGPFTKSLGRIAATANIMFLSVHNGKGVLRHYLAFDLDFRAWLR